MASTTWGEKELPETFSKTAPVNGASDVTTNPTITWQSSEGASSYEFCYDTINNNACSNWISNGTSTSKTLSGLAYGTTYYWHVRAVNTVGETYANGGETAFWSFTTTAEQLPPGVFSKSGPPDGAVSVAINPILTWEISDNAASYQYCYDTINDDACSNWISSGSSTSIQVNGLSSDTTYY